jgi:hypothetical protein
MPDPFGVPTNRDPMRGVMRKSHPLPWTFGVIAALAVLAVIFFGMQKSDDRTAINPNTTTGQRTQADPPPLTSEPNTTMGRRVPRPSGRQYRSTAAPLARRTMR